MFHLSIVFGASVCFMVPSGLACSSLDALSATEMLWWDSKHWPQQVVGQVISTPHS